MTIFVLWTNVKVIEWKKMWCRAVLFIVLLLYVSSGQCNGALKRKKRFVFGIYQSYPVKKQFLETFPFDAIVQLNVGCTGTLIWYKHVLTAAHCLHDGKNLKYNKDQIKIGFLNTNKTIHWMAINKIHVPAVWTRRKKEKFMSHDYAVIELREQHNRNWIDFGVYDVGNDENIQFAGFPSNEYSLDLWFSYCSNTKKYQNYLLNYCDAEKGMSGSGVFVYDKYNNNRKKIMAVFSAHLLLNQKDRQSYVNLAVILTHKFVRKICKWIGAGHNCRKLTKSPHYRNI